MVEDDLKIDILDDLCESLKRANAIEVKLTLLHKQIEADKFAKAAKKLSRRIDDAMGELIDEWAEQSSTILEDIGKLNTKLKAIRKKLEKDVDNTEQIIDAIAHIDNLAIIARQLLKP